MDKKIEKALHTTLESWNRMKKSQEDDAEEDANQFEASFYALMEQIRTLVWPVRNKAGNAGRGIASTRHGPDCEPVAHRDFAELRNGVGVDRRRANESGGRTVRLVACRRGGYTFVSEEPVRKGKIKNCDHLCQSERIHKNQMES